MLLEKAAPGHQGPVACFWGLETEGEAKSSDAGWGRGEPGTSWGS